VTKKKKSSKARFSVEPETVGFGPASPGEIEGEFNTGDSNIYRTKNGKTRSMGFTLPDAEAEAYASELQRETRGMKKGGKVSSASNRADGCAQRGKTRGMMK
jgi:hypothetical protein